MRRVRPDLHALEALRALVAAERRTAAAGAGHLQMAADLAWACTGSATGWLPMSTGTGTGTVPTGRHGPGRSGSGSAGPAPYPADDPEQQRVAALVTLAQQGDGEAFGQIYDRYVDSVYRYLYYRVGSHPLAEDLTSETFVRALRRIDSFRWQGKDIGAWFVTIARNLVTDHFKSSRFRLEVSTADMLDADRADEGIEDTVLDHLRNAELLGAVQQLKPEQQECIVLRFLQGLSVAETAEVMRRSEGAVKQLQLRAVRTLAKLVPGPVT
ncbi:MAG: ECF subfamily RNA polymerase sigma factor, BldN family [Actinomycetes bacterium]